MSEASVSTPAHPLSLAGFRATLAGRVLMSWKGGISGAWLIMLVLAALLAPLIAPFPFDVQNLDFSSRPPAVPHLLGTDEFGRDVLSRIIYGARTSLSVSGLAISVSITVGMLLGAAAGYFGGLFDRLVTAATDLSWSFPEILVALILVAIIGPGLESTMAAIAIAYLAQFTRITRSQILSLKNEPYIEAARSVGVRTFRLLFVHIFPNLVPPIIVQATLAMAVAVIAEASLSFLGLGRPPPAPSWGSMLTVGKDYIASAPWLSIWPGLCIFLVTVGFSLLGDGLRQSLDRR
jgi:peptide/nickel transport system permease protein